jgi:hypothetical protein
MRTVPAAAAVTISKLSCTRHVWPCSYSLTSLYASTSTAQQDARTLSALVILRIRNSNLCGQASPVPCSAALICPSHTFAPAIRRAML